MGAIRTERIGEEVRGELARLLRDEVSDPRVAMVSLTRVKVAPDLSTAAVFWSPLDPRASDVARIAEGLASAAGFLRSRLAAVLSLRRTPELHFRHDPSLALGAETLALLRELEPPRDLEEAADE
jgi:ribosome-binding factor A